MLQQKTAIPSYFSPGAAGDPDWAAAAGGSPLLAIVVLNPASGPGYQPSHLPGGEEHTEFQHRIDQMHAAGADVVGYVTTNYRDSRDSTVQAEYTFTVDAVLDLVVTAETGWTSGFGPIQVRSASTLPGGLASGTDYFWIPVSATTGQFAGTRAHAIDRIAIDLTSAGGADGTHAMGLSRSLANISNVISEIDQFYARWPTIDGMFFDEMTDSDEPEDLEYYGRLHDHVKSKGGKAVVIQNPGSGFPESMVGVADIFLSYESYSAEYADHDPAWQLKYPAAKFWHAIHSCPAAEMPAIIDLSRAKNAGYVYVTDLVHPSQNIWERIATNFAAEISEMSSRNAPAISG